jgi:hypothetical protein
LLILKAEKTFYFDLETTQNSLNQFEESEKLEIGLNELIESIYPIKAGDERMRKMLERGKVERIKYFDLLRKIIQEEESLIITRFNQTTLHFKKEKV